MSDTESLPDELVGFPIQRQLTPDRSWLGIASGGKRVVIKTLDADCLLRGQLHRSIKERLSRVRELAHPGVANLRGVERDASGTYLVWDHVDGKTFDEYVLGHRARDVARLAREVVLSVESLHGQGIIHGAIHGRNVIVQRDGTVRLTHISPLLYDNPADDTAAVLALLREAVKRTGHEKTKLADLLDGAGTMSLRRLRLRLTALIESRDAVPVSNGHSAQDRQIRRRAILSAMIVGILGIAIAAGVVYYVRDLSSRPQKTMEVRP